jgi:hypothetical protein
LRSRIVHLLSDIAGRASAFGEPILGHLCRMAAIEAETTYIPWTDIWLSKIACIWDWDVLNDLNHLDGPGAELFGVSPSAASRGLPNDRYLSAIHPDDVDDVRRPGGCSETGSVRGAVSHRGKWATAVGLWQRVLHHRSVKSSGTLRWRAHRIGLTIRLSWRLLLGTPF